MISIYKLPCRTNFQNIRPALAAGDIDGNGFDDIVIGGNAFVHAQIVFTTARWKIFTEGLCLQVKIRNRINYKDAGLLLFDANGDGNLDLYIASGGYKYKQNSSNYQDRLYINDGKGNFARAVNALPGKLHQ